MKKVLLLALVILTFISCDKNEIEDKFKDDNLENSFWRFSAENVDKYGFSVSELSNGIVVNFRPGQTLQLYNYIQNLDDESKWVSNKDTLNSFTIDANGQTYVVSSLKKINKTKYVGSGELYSIVYESKNGIRTKKRSLECNFNAIGERLTEAEAKSFINKKHERALEVLNNTKWKLIVNAPFNPNTTWQSDVVLKDTILNIEFKWFHGVYVYGYPYFSKPDSTEWIKYEKISKAINGNWWYQTSDTNFVFNVGFNTLSINHSMRFNGVIRNNTVLGTCYKYSDFTKYNFKGTKQ